MTAIDHFRHHLRRLTEERGMCEFARQAGVSRIYLRHIIRGQQVPSLTICQAIADAAGQRLPDMLSPLKKISAARG